MRPLRKLSFGLVGTAIALYAQSAGGPIVGWSVQADGATVRTIFGVPGASRVGDPIAATGLRIVELSPTATLSLAVSADGSPAVHDVASGATTLLPGASPNPDAAIWSPSGTAFALIYRDAGRVQLFVGAAGSYALREEFAAQPDSLAVADDGRAVLLRDGAGLTLRATAASLRLTDDPSASFAFLAGAAVPVYYSAGQLRIGDNTIPFDTGGAEAPRLRSTRADRLVAVVASSGTLRVFDDAGRAIFDSKCACTVDGLNAAGTPDILQLTKQGTSGPVWLLQTGDDPRVFFVPPPQSNPSGGVDR
jgi:hypothetical protein